MSVRWGELLITETGDTRIQFKVNRKLWEGGSSWISSESDVQIERPSGKITHLKSQGLRKWTRRIGRFHYADLITQYRRSPWYDSGHAIQTKANRQICGAIRGCRSVRGKGNADVLVQNERIGVRQLNFGAVFKNGFGILVGVSKTNCPFIFWETLQL